MPLLEFQIPCWEHLDLSNEQMNLGCLWNTSSHDMTALFQRLGIDHSYLKPDGTAWGRRFVVFSFALLEVQSRELLHRAHPLLLCHGTSCNNRIMLKELFLAYLESLRAMQLPSNTASELIAVVLNTVFLLHSHSLCVKCRVFKSLI